MSNNNNSSKTAHTNHGVRDYRPPNDFSSWENSMKVTIQQLDALNAKDAQKECKEGRRRSSIERCLYEEIEPLPEPLR